MELLSCSVAIGGDIRAVVPKPKVSVAEILLLQHVHGANAVTNIKIVGEMDGDSTSERDRLGSFYGDERVVQIFNQFGELPTTLSEARIDNNLLDPVWRNERAKEEAAKKRTSRKKAEPAVED